MSRAATDWAWSLTIKPATSKLILLSMADRADEEHCCFPSIDRLVRDTSLDKKTITAGIAKLEQAGFIRDTGERKGKTQRVRVFRLNIDKNWPIKQAQKRNDSENGNEPKNGSLNEPKNGSLNEPKNGSQNQSVEPVIEPTKDSGGFSIPDWMPETEWNDFVEHRKQIKASMSEKAKTLAVNKLDKLRKEGHSPSEVLEQSIINGWKGVFPTKKAGNVHPFPRRDDRPDPYANHSDCGGNVYIPGRPADSAEWRARR